MEEWRPVVGYEGLYEISSCGRARRTASTNRLRTDGVLKPRLQLRPGRPSGDFLVGLRRDGKRQTARVHTLVATAFLGPRPDDCEVNHLDGNPQNNAASNLEWATHSENMRHSYRLGVHDRRGARHNQAKFSDEVVRQIRALRGVFSQRQIARQFGTSGGVICDIQNRKRWAHVLVIVLALALSAAVATESRADVADPSSPEAVASGAVRASLSEHGAKGEALREEQARSLAGEDMGRDVGGSPSRAVYPALRPLARTTSLAHTSTVIEPIAQSIEQIITNAAIRRGLDPLRLSAVATCESGHRLLAVGRDQELGLFQFKPTTWEFISRVSGLGYSIELIFDAEAQSEMAAWAFANGYGGWWSCQ